MYGTFMRENREIPLLARRVDRRVGRPGNVDGGTPGMNECGKSDRLVVPVNSPNKTRAVVIRSGSVEESVDAVAEVGEGRGRAEGNTVGPARSGRGAGSGVSLGLDRVREVAVRDKDVRFTALLHHVDVASLRRAYGAIRPQAAPGVDGVTWVEYGQDLEGNLRDLHARVQSGRYRAKPSRRVYIPKADGRQRPLGIASLEDKIVQRAVVEVLNAVYEADFRGFSYGFRPGRKPHDALDALTVAITERRVNWVLDADVRDFFGQLDHVRLGELLRHRIADERVLRLIGKWLTVGVVEDGAWTDSDLGSPQGASVSPLLANVYLHYVFDEWADQWRRTRASGDVVIVRFADDFVVGFEDEGEARAFWADLREQFAEFGLELHPDKTRLIEFGRNADWKRRRRGLGKPETFDFLGFTHIGARSRRGRFWVKRITIAKRMRAKLAEVKDQLRRRRHDPVPEQGAWLRSVLQGHANYYAVPGNFDAVNAFRTQITRHWYKTLRRRSQKTRLTWARMGRLATRWLPPVRVLHPFPNQRLIVTTQGRSPVR
jgi:group II intron reverse transcriptase/maturase